MSGQKLQVGQQVLISRIISEQDINVFSEISMDHNPVHFDDTFAAKTIYGKRIAHGMIGASLVSGALTELMGAGNILLSLNLDFKGPIFIGDKITCTLTIREIVRRNLATIDVEISNYDSKPVIVGTAKSMRSVASS